MVHTSTSLTTRFSMIKIDNTGDGEEDISYEFRFKSQFKNPNTILDIAAPNQALAGAGGIEPLITSLDDPDYNEPQIYSVPFYIPQSRRERGGCAEDCPAYVPLRV